MAIIPGLTNFLLIPGLKLIEPIKFIRIGKRLLEIAYDKWRCAAPMTPSTVIPGSQK
jgi:hypothetical protein